MALSSLSIVGLAIQVVTLVLICFGAYLMRYKRQLRIHPYVMLTAVVLNVTTILLIMLPSLGRLLRSAGAIIDWTTILTLVHHTVGLIALGMSIVLVGGWLISGLKPNGCPGSAKNKRRIMQTTFIAWISALVLGFVVYTIYL